MHIYRAKVNSTTPFRVQSNFYFPLKRHWDCWCIEVSHHGYKKLFSISLWFGITHTLDLYSVAVALNQPLILTLLPIWSFLVRQASSLCPCAAEVTGHLWLRSIASLLYIQMLPTSRLPFLRMMFIKGLCSWMSSCLGSCLQYIPLQLHQLLFTLKPHGAVLLLS